MFSVLSKRSPAKSPGLSLCDLHSCESALDVFRALFDVQDSLSRWALLVYLLPYSDEHIDSTYNELQTQNLCW